MKLRLAVAAVLLAVAGAYSNHFQNSFHFDDFHTIAQNPYIRNLRNIPRFFTDAATFSTLPANRTYRPLVSTSLAFDYWLGGGLKPVYFHAATFLVYLLQLALMFALFRRLLRADYAALFAAALYGLHPAMAETVNYIIQRGDIYATCGVVAGLALYALAPRLRRFGLYLAPVALAMLAKPPAVVFPALLFAYIFLFEERAGALRRCVPAIVVVAAMMLLQARMTPPSFVPGIVSAHDYIAAQPYVTLHYFISFFLPIWLTADSDQQPLTTIFCAQGLLGLLFLAAVLWAIYATAKRPRWRPIAFGLLWFLLALIPTSVYPLSEVENDHRMFFPFVGLALAVTWAAVLWARPRRVIAIAGVALLAVFACGTWQRNRVWRTEETLWRDAARKSPRNGRALMNYGLTLMDRGQAAAALVYFERALPLTPNYATLEINLGIAYGALLQDTAAEAHFRRAIALAPNDAQASFFYARWLNQHARPSEAIAFFVRAIAQNGDYLDPRYALMQAYADEHESATLHALAQDTLRRFPGDRIALAYASLAPAAEARPTPEGLVLLARIYNRLGRYRESLQTARQALALRPGYAEAYDGIVAAYQALGEWDEAIAASQEQKRLAKH